MKWDSQTVTVVCSIVLAFCALGVMMQTGFAEISSDIRELRTRINDVESGLRAEISNVDSRLRTLAVSVDERFDRVDDRFDSIDRRLTRVEVYLFEIEPESEETP